MNWVVHKLVMDRWVDRRVSGRGREEIKSKTQIERQRLTYKERVRHTEIVRKKDRKTHMQTRQALKTIFYTVRSF